MLITVEYQWTNMIAWVFGSTQTDPAALAEEIGMGASLWTYYLFPPGGIPTGPFGVRNQQSYLDFWANTDLPWMVLMVNAPTASVGVNDGRWLASCPSCGSAQIASATDKQFCCADASCDLLGILIPATWPDDYFEIDELLTQRVNPFDRNWEPVSTAADISAQNAANPVELLGRPVAP